MRKIIIVLFLSVSTFLFSISCHEKNDIKVLYPENEKPNPPSDSISKVNSKPENLILVCGGTQVLLVDYYNSTDSKADIVWSWDARLAKDLPDVYKNKKFNHLDDCKAIRNGNKIMISSSSGAIAIINIENKAVEFYADVEMAHSIEMLPDNKIVAAASTHVNGNKLMVFDIDVSNEVLFTDSLYSAHGVVWDEKRNSLFAIGYDVLREYKIENKIKLVQKQEWKIPGKGGHDLLMAPNGDNLYLTETTSAWVFDIEKKQFKAIPHFPNAKNIKSIGENKIGQFIYTLPEESWWTFNVSFHNPKSKIPFPNIRVYKARWFKF